MVNRLADHAWCAAPARPISSTAGQSPTRVTQRIGSTHNAKMNMLVFRARVIDQPRFSSVPESDPPAMLSTVMIA